MKRGVMMVADVEERVETIRSLAAAGDHEGAHGAEDLLYIDILRQILTPSGRGGEPSAKKLAEAALKSQLIEFERWCG